MPFRMPSKVVPSGLDSFMEDGNNWLVCEDARVELNVETVNPATRISGYLEKTWFSTVNHCIPVYEVLEMPEKGVNFLVMPFLSFWERPPSPFEPVGEAVDCIGQMFKEMAFMHSLDIAHNHTKWNNFMMDSAPLCDEPVHPADFAMNKDYTRASKHRSRTKRPVKYYYVDFGNTRQYNPEDGIPQCILPYGGDMTVPEFKTQKYCEPYPVDVYHVGNIIREHFTEGNPMCGFSMYGFDFMKPLLKDMCQDDPAKRPVMEGVSVRSYHISFKLVEASFPRC